MAEHLLTRKIGPLPAWGWLAAVSLGVILYLRHANAKTATGAVGPGMDPNAIDPNTGMTYGQEMGLGLTPTTGASTDGSGGGGSGNGWNGSGPNYIDPNSVIGQLLNDLFPFNSGPTATGEPAGSRKRRRHVGSGKSNTGRRHRGRSPATSHGGGRNSGGGHAKRGSTHRAPAHPNENTSHQHHSHVAPPGAKHRVKTHHGGSGGHPHHDQHHDQHHDHNGHHRKRR